MWSLCVGWIIFASNTNCGGKVKYSMQISTMFYVVWFIGTLANFSLGNFIFSPLYSNMTYKICEISYY